MYMYGIFVDQEFYAAKREAARVARQEKAKQETRNAKQNKTDENLKKILDDSAFASWLSDEDDDLDE